jgi:hypothetical protein
MFCDLRYGAQGRFVFQDGFQGRPLAPFQNRPARFSNPGSTPRFLNVVQQAKGIRAPENYGAEIATFAIQGYRQSSPAANRDPAM